MTGILNVGIGVNPLTLNTTGGFNTAVGVGSMDVNTTGGSNTAMGLNSLTNNTVGDNNTALGVSALFSNVAGDSSVAIGVNSQGNVNDTSTPFTNTNTSVGFDALRGTAPASGNTGLDNTAIGYQASASNTTGGSNVALGKNALNANTSGSLIVAIGKDALSLSTTAVNNVGIGYFALRATTGNWNTALGTQAGDGNTTGTLNTLIGYLADVSATGLTNATAIGANSVVSQSNALVLGNGTADVGINTSTPDEKLHVVGSIKMVDGNEAADKVFTSDANGVGSWQSTNGGGNTAVISRTTSTQNFGSTTLTDVTGLSVTVDVSSTYKMVGALIFTSASATPDGKIAFTFNDATGATIAIALLHMVVDSGSNNRGGRLTSAGTGSTRFPIGSNNFGVIHFIGTFTTGASSTAFKAQFAQFQTDGSNDVITQAGGVISVTKL